MTTMEDTAMTTTTVVSPRDTPGPFCDDDDALWHMLSYLDLRSAVRLLCCTCHAWRRADLTGRTRYPRLWRLWYDRCGHAPSRLAAVDAVSEHPASDAIWKTLVTSRRLSRNLLGPSSPKEEDTKNKKKSRSNCFSLPNRWFSFYPVSPDDAPFVAADDDDIFLQYDPPPVSFDCDSFLLTGQGTEFVFLNPFTMTLTVHKSILDQTIPSDEGMLEQAFRAASHRIVERRQRGDNDNSDMNSSSSSSSDETSSDNQHQYENDDDEEHLLAADAIDETIHRHYHHPRRAKPAQTLVNLTETVDLDLTEYFDPPRERSFGSAVDDFQDEEYEVSHGGIDVKPVFGDDGTYRGTLLALGRIIARLSDDEGEEEDCCWEVLTWYKGCAESDAYTPAGSCRLRGNYNSLDICPRERVVYVNPSRPADAADWGDDDNIFTLWAGQKTIQAIPLLDINSDNKAKQTRSVGEWKCRDNVTAMVVSSGICTSSVILVGTSARNLELYQRTSRGTALMQIISISSAMTVAQERHPSLVERAHPAPVTEILCARELPLNMAGFWTLQHNSVHGSTLLLWKRGPEGAFDVEAVIQLPLSSLRTPKILYDGRRLLVYGQDHIGMILLAYQVRYSNEDNDAFDQVPIGQATCGGVVNVGQGDVAAVKFANRIRHVALSGMENVLYEALYMTANERFVVLNTKGGNHLSGSSPYREGLLVIDLQDEEETL